MTDRLFIFLRLVAAPCLIAVLAAPETGLAQEPAQEPAWEPADEPAPPPEQFPPVEAEPQIDPFRSLYMVMSLSVGGVEDAHANAGFEAEYGFEAGVDFGIGYAAGPFRVEAVFLGHRAEVFDINPDAGSGLPAVQYGGWLEMGGVMANAYFDFDLSPRLRPYIGGGIGYGYVEALYSESNCVFACALEDHLVDDSDTVKLWQGMAGISILRRVGLSDIAFYAGYRYLRSEDMQFRLVDGTPFEQDGLRAHILEMGVRLHFP